MSQKNDFKKVTIVEFHPTSPGFKEESKEETKEETKEQIPEEPSSDFSESVETLSSEELTVGENEDYLDVEKLILYLVKIRKSKRLTELLVSKLFKLIKNKAGLQFEREDTDVIINNHIRKNMFFSKRLIHLLGKIQKLAKISEDVSIEK